jgi:hypothetical protein
MNPGLWVELVIGGTDAGVTSFYDAGRFKGVRLAPGAGRVRRFREPGGPRHLLIAEVADVDAARTYLRNALPTIASLDDCPAPQTRALLTTRVPGATHGIACEGHEGALKFVVGMAVNPAHEEEYNRWYDEEHIPILMRHDGWLGARRYRCESQVAEYLTIYEAAHDRLLSPSARADVRSTEWSRDVLAKAFVTHTKAYFTELGAARA